RGAWIAYESRSALPLGRRHETAGHDADQDRRRPGGLVLHSTRDHTWSSSAPDLVVLVRVHADSSGTFSVSSVAGGTPSLEVDPGSLPLYWLAAAEDSESIAFLASLGTDAAEMDVQEMLIDVIGVHGDSSVVVPYLSHVLAGDYPRSLRAAAVEGLSWHPSSVVIEQLRAVALCDRSKHVRREAAEALGQTGATAAVAALVDIVSAQGAPPGTRARAVQALGSFREPEVLPVLTGIAFDAGDPKEVQREAVEAVAEIGLPEAVPLLERIAVEHPVPSVRREAVEELADTGRPAGLEVLFRIAMADPDARIQREAVEKIADFQLRDAAPFLARLAWEHASGAIRREAVHLIGTMPEALGRPILEDIAAGDPDLELRQEATTVIEGWRGSCQEQGIDLLPSATPAESREAPRN
ncbi:MAG TPA: HEAT repeat domain-containing protein, partial [Candidatus Polarisedimenticolia bacterium]|nr:HEAT repeat domain-containing protein [Candidatus Polarisedimenticolia bacterium]